MPTRGGSGSGAQSTTVAAIQGHSPRPKAPAPPSLPPTIPGALSAGPPTGPATNFPAPVITRNGAAQSLQGDGGAIPDVGGGPGAFTGSSIIPENASSLPYSPSGGPVNSPQFTYFPLYTLDYIQGTVLFPDGYQLATLDGNVNLRAQVKNTTGVTFSWDTSGLTNANSIATSGTGNRDLTFTWETSNSTATVDSVTLTATDPTNSDQECQTYYFEVPAGTVSTNTGSQ